MPPPALQLFGSLESEIMRIFWRRKEATVRDVLELLCQDRAIAYTTVMTVMNRLVEKNLLIRKQDGGAYIYSAAKDCDSFFGDLARRFSTYLMKQFGSVAVAQFMDAFDDVELPKKKSNKTRLPRPDQGRSSQ